MENIFLNAYFGKPYTTRDGRKAICDGITEGLLCFSIEGYTKNHGIIYLAGDEEITFLTPWLEEELKGCGDIVAEWIEPIDKEKLDGLAEHWCPESGSYREGDIETQKVIRNAYKAGYEQGWEDKK